MKKQNKKRGGSIAMLVLVVIVLNLVYVSAFSVGFGSNVAIEPGQNKETGFTLLNKGANAENLVAQVVVEEGSQYVNFPDGDTYDVPAGERTSVPVVFSVPSSANPGDVYSVRIAFRTTEGGNAIGGGTIEFDVGHSFTVELEVFDEVPTHAPEPTPTPTTTPDEGMSTIWYWVIAIIVVIIIIWFVVKKKK